VINNWFWPKPAVYEQVTHDSLGVWELLAGVPASSTLRKKKVRRPASL
jgi:hypothetical protein